MNVWDLITTSSSLPVQSGTNLWDHLNSLGDGTIVIGGDRSASIDLRLEAKIDTNLTASVSHNLKAVSEEEFDAKVTITKGAKICQ